LSDVTDASDVAIGASLKQEYDGHWKLLGFFSRKLTSTETRYCTYDRELHGVYAKIKFFQHKLDGRDFVIKADHKPLMYASTQKLDKGNPRCLRQFDFYSQFSNSCADALSRLCQINMPATLEAQEPQEEQENDSELKDLLDEGNASLKLQKLSIDATTSIYCDTSSGYIRPYIPVSLRQRVFVIIHNPPHPIGKATCQHLPQKYVWPNMRKDILSWCRTCISCQRAKFQR
jgi:cleavage and polyadenylation specificity factor subunit 1